MENIRSAMDWLCHIRHKQNYTFIQLDIKYSNLLINETKQDKTSTLVNKSIKITNYVLKLIK